MLIEFYTNTLNFRKSVFSDSGLVFFITFVNYYMWMHNAYLGDVDCCQHYLIQQGFKTNFFCNNYYKPGPLLNSKLYIN